MTKKQKKMLKRIIIASVLMIVLGFLPVTGFLKFALYMVPYFVIGHDILRKAFLGVKNKQMFDESFLMAVATVGAILLGEYTEGVAVMLFFQIGELFQSIAVGRSRKSITELMDACDYYFEKTKRRIYFEYALCDGINNSKECVAELAKLVKGKVCHVNLINLNAVEGKALKGVTSKQAYKFVQDLNDLGVSATLRRTLGEDIDGACGQLRKRMMEEVC